MPKTSTRKPISLPVVGDYPVAGKDYTLALPKGYLSVSQIEKYLNCPEAYRRAYVVGEKQETNSNLWYGSMTALALAHLHRGKYTPVKIAKEIKAHKKECDNWESRHSVEGCIGFVLDCMEAYQKDGVAKPRKNGKQDGVEEEFVIEVAGVKVKGVIDLVEKQRVTDFKTTGNASGYLPESSIQLAIYALATGVSNVGFKSFVRNYSGEYTKMVKDYTMLDLKKVRVWLERTVAEVARGISLGVFPLTNPMRNKLCCDTYCSFHPTCAVNWKRKIKC